MQQRLRESYLEMADSNKTFVAPAGAAWRNSIIADSTINLYQTDNSHPSVEGTYLTACVFYAAIYNKSPIGNFFMSSLGHGTAVSLQTIAKQTVLDSASNWRIGKYALPKSCGVVDTSLSSSSMAETNNHQVLVYPNPATKQLTVRSYQLIVNAIEVIDVLGRVMVNLSNHNESQPINIEALQNGVYFMKVIDNKGFKQIVKFVKE
jgi:hypothetical protein